MIKLNFSSIRQQFFSLLVILVVMLIISYTTVAYFIKGAHYREASIQEMDVLTRALENDYAELIILALPSSSREVVHKWRSFPSILHADLEDALGNPILHFTKDNGPHNTIRWEANEGETMRNGQLVIKRPITYADKQVGWVSYAVLSPQGNQLWTELQKMLLVSAPFLLLFVVCLVMYLQHLVVSPLQALIARLSMIVELQNYNTVLEVSTDDRSEFASLRRHFNALLTRVQKSIASAHKAELHAQDLAHFDDLTGLANRRLLLEHMEYILEIANRENKHGTLLFVDLDNFKTLNDSRGHAAGDELLKKVAANIKKVFRKEDTVARLGGDEFVILSGQLEDSEEAATNQVYSLMQKLRDVLSENFTIQGEVYQLTASVGISTFPRLASSSSELMKQADTAMYRAKEAGRDTYRFYQPEMQAAVDARLQMESELRYAITAEELELFYQPQVDEFGRVLGAEALLRWFKGENVVSPADFIPVAELTGLILPIGEWVLRRAFMQLKQWLNEGVDPNLNLSINISPLQFYQEAFVSDVQSLLNETGIPAKNITLEVTEGMAIKDIQASVDKMHVLKEIGFKVSMDDFGTGYSSLTYLKRLPLNELKIDQSFVRDLDVDKADAELAATIIAMAKNLHLDVVAEGVETEEQLQFLCRHGCSIFQGYYFHKPMRPAELSELLSGNLVIL